QDRFADATRAIGLPTPILREPPQDRRDLYWFAAALAVSAALVSIVLRGFGDPANPLVLAPPLYIGVYAALAGGAAFCLLRGLSNRNSRASTPYRPGLYLFPAGVFDARSEPIRVFLHPDLRETAVVDGSSVRVGAAGGEFLFRAADPQAAE